MNAPIEATSVATTKSIRAALFCAQRDVGGVAKDSTAKVNPKEGASYSYKFTSSEDMLEHCRHALHQHGLSWEMVHYEIEGTLGAKRGYDRNEPAPPPPMLVGHFELVHAESGEMLCRTYRMPIASRNDADKALSGAITYLLGQATRLLLLVPKVSEEDAKNDPDRRERHVDDQPRSERRIVPATAPKQAPLGEPGRHYTEGELARLRHDCQRAVDLAKPLLDKKAPELRKAAGLPEGSLSGQQLARYRKWLLESIDIHGGVVPEWSLEWDPYDQRAHAAELRDET